jgi:hypothetical protein
MNTHERYRGERDRDRDQSGGQVFSRGAGALK